MHSLVFSELLFMIWDWNNKVCLWFSCALEVALPSFRHQMLFFASKLWIFFAKNRSKALNFWDFRCPSLVKKYPFTGKNVFYSYDFWTKGPKCRTHKTDLKNDTKQKDFKKVQYRGPRKSHSKTGNKFLFPKVFTNTYSTQSIPKCAFTLAKISLLWCECDPTPIQTNYCMLQA